MSDAITRLKVEYKGFLIVLSYRKYKDEEGWDYTIKTPKELELYDIWPSDWLQSYDDALKDAQDVIDRRVREAIEELEAKLELFRKFQ